MDTVSCVSSDNSLLHVVHNNRVGRPAIVFLHGACSSHHVWKYQFNDELLDEQFHLIALDMRGHGLSSKPDSSDAYREGRYWADDLDSVLTHFNLTQCVLVAWSYGGRMVNDYLRYYGTSHLLGINFIAAGTLATNDVKGPGYTVLGDMFSEDPMRVSKAEEQFVHDLAVGVTHLDLIKHLNEDLKHCPMYVRDAMRQRDMDYDDILKNLDVPVLLTHGEDDRYSLVKLAYLLNNHIPHTSLSILKRAGHLPFVQRYQEYNKSLYAFVSTLVT
tara:strand:- start:185 stop:1003 length:819 start_codon:yes stop_codon:yes gene_type:complete